MCCDGDALGFERDRVCACCCCVFTPAAAETASPSAAIVSLQLDGGVSSATSNVAGGGGRGAQLISSLAADIAGDDCGVGGSSVVTGIVGDGWEGW